MKGFFRHSHTALDAPEIILCDSVNEVTGAFRKIPSGNPDRFDDRRQPRSPFGQCCFEPGSVKATYGTGSSVMMNIGAEPNDPPSGSSLLSRMRTKDGVCYCPVSEGHINTNRRDHSGCAKGWESLESVFAVGIK